jgi:hypothetical protein
VRVRLHGIHYNADTKWPEGFNPKAAGAIPIKEEVPASIAQESVDS